ncbi:MAG TPA: hypothetical protein VIU37_10980 [Candidatus Limnocylindrales bacterium]
MPRIRPLVALCAVLLLAGCSAAGSASTSTSASAPSVGQKSSVLPVIISSELATGTNRFLFSFLDATSNSPVGAPDRTASVAFTGPGGQTVAPADGTFIWAIENVSGIYVSTVDFPASGDWVAHFTTAAAGKPAEQVDFQFQVLDKKHVIVPGDKAPSVDTPTLASVGGDVAKLSTDAHPDKAFYETSVAAALAAHKPFVLVFATPKFCQTQTCGPTLDKVKPIAAAHPDVTFINVEPYQLKDDQGQLQPVLDANGQLQTVPATDAYGLLSEPYVFVVGGDGIVKASFELIFTPAEIDQALAGLK